AARFRPCRHGSRSCLSFFPTDAPAAGDRAHGAGHRSLAHPSIISRRASRPEARQNDSKLAEMFDSASSFSALVGIAVDVVNLFMALLSFVESAPRSLSAQGGQRRFSYFNIVRDNSTFFDVHSYPYLNLTDFADGNRKTSSQHAGQCMCPP